MIWLCFLISDTVCFFTPYTVNAAVMLTPDCSFSFSSNLRFTLQYITDLSFTFEPILVYFKIEDIFQNISVLRKYSPHVTVQCKDKD